MMDVRPWRIEDAPVLSPMIRDFLSASVRRGGDLLSTQKNAQMLFELGVSWAILGMPTLVATHAYDMIVGYIQWGWIPAAFDLRWRTCHALGSYVAAEVRHQGVARMLRDRGREMCLEAGIERIMGPVHLVNQRGIEEFVAQGAWPTTVQMEVLL